MGNLNRSLKSKAVYLHKWPQQIDFNSSVKVLSCWRDRGWYSSWNTKGQKAGWRKRKKDIRRTCGAQRNLCLRRFSNWTGQGPGSWTGQSLLYWCLGLWSCFLPCSLLSWLAPSVSVIKVSISLHIPRRYLLACKHEVQPSVSSLISFSVTCVK